MEQYRKPFSTVVTSSEWTTVCTRPSVALLGCLGSEIHLFVEAVNEVGQTFAQA